jgi:hypothetical protein
VVPLLKLNITPNFDLLPSVYIVPWELDSGKGVFSHLGLNVLKFFPWVNSHHPVLTQVKPMIKFLVRLSLKVIPQVVHKRIPKWYLKIVLIPAQHLKTPSWMDGAWRHNFSSGSCSTANLPIARDSKIDVHSTGWPQSGKWRWCYCKCSATPAYP